MRSLAWCWWIPFTLTNGKSTPKQLRIWEVGLRYAWIAAWLARLGGLFLPGPPGGRFA